MTIDHIKLLTIDHIKPLTINYIKSSTKRQLIELNYNLI